MVVRVDIKKLKQATKKVNNLKVGIQAGDEVVVAEGINYFRFMQVRASRAYQETKWYIKEGAVTQTGIERGSPRGRYDTGDMYRAFIMTPGGGKTTTPGKKKVKFFFEMGWLGREPYYTIFQEFGTKNGIKGMAALEYGKQALEDHVVREHSRSQKEFARAIAEGWAQAMRTGKWTPRTTRPSKSWWSKVAVDED